MKFIHLADLHLGKRVYEFSMLDDQQFILDDILKIIDDEKPDAVFIAGDIYDKSIPPTEAIEHFDRFLVNLASRKIPVFIISGNHDSPERLAFANRLIDMSGIHLSPVYNGDVSPYRMSDDYGDIDIFMLPFVKPANVHRFYPDDEINSFTDAVRTAIAHMPVDPSVRNILITHQFITGAARSDSEELSVGGADDVDVSVFDDFDYVALGHIHSPQNIESERVRYSGTPLKYSFSETAHDKSVTVVELGKKGELDVRTIPLTPKHDMVEIKGTYNNVTLKSFYEGTTYRDDYVHITLTDEEDVPDAVGKLRVIYPKLMKLDYDNKRTRHNAELHSLEAVEEQTPLELFSDFYEQCNNAPMSEVQSEYIKKLIEDIWEDEA